ncbi:MAG: hypothetical protein ABI622_09615 [Chloroflexota bacterium]
MTDAHDTLTDDLAATVEATRLAERELFGSLDAATRERPIREGDWNPQDFQAHLTAWKARQADRYAAVREGRQIPAPMESEEEDALNEELRAARAEWAWDALVEEADAVTARLVGEIRQADPATLRASERLIAGTFGNGLLHAITHVRWLLEAGVPLDAPRAAAFAAEATDLVSAAGIPDRDRAIGWYDLACNHALGGRADAARQLLREAFRVSPDLVEFARTDADLASLAGELDDLVRS